MTSVFVSHSSLDHELVSSLIVGPLQKQGLEVWYSRDSIHAAEEWEKRIRHALLSCDWFLVALSPNSVQSQWVQAEVDWALEHRLGRLLPVLIDDCDPQDCNLRLRTLQHIDLRHNNPQGHAALLQVWPCGSIVGQAPSPPTSTVLSQRSGVLARGRRVITLAAVATAIVLAVAIGVGLMLRSNSRDDKELSDKERGIKNIQAHSSASAGPEPNIVAASTPAASAARVVHQRNGAATTTAPVASVASHAPQVAAAEPPMLVDLTLARPTDAAKGDSEPDPDPSTDPRVSYSFRRKDSVLNISFQSPYLECQRQGKMIGGLDVSKAPFRVEIPAIGVAVLNNTNHNAVITECIVEVVASKIDERPVLVVADHSVECLEFFDEGWGPVVDPVVTVSLQGHPGENSKTSAHVRLPPLKADTFDQRCAIRLTKYIPEEMQDERYLEAVGEVEFGPTGGRQRVPFETHVYLDITPGSPLPPSYIYDLKLTAGKAPDEVRIPIEQFMKTGDPDHFLVRVISDKSAHYELKVGFRLIDGRELPGQRVVLELFVPRTQARRLAKATANAADPN